LLRATKWDQVDPGVEPVLTADYPDSRVRVMVVGNYQAGLASYQ